MKMTRRGVFGMVAGAIAGGAAASAAPAKPKWLFGSQGGCVIPTGETLAGAQRFFDMLCHRRRMRQIQAIIDRSKGGAGFSLTLEERAMFEAIRREMVDIDDVIVQIERVWPWTHPSNLPPPPAAVRKAKTVAEVLSF